MPILKTKITTPQLEATRDFYRSIFQLVVIEEWDEPNDRGVILAFANGEREALLEIYHGPNTANFSGLSLQFRVDSLEQFVARLPTQVAHKGPTPRPWGSTYLYLEDPNQIQIVVYEGGGDHPASLGIARPTAQLKSWDPATILPARGPGGRGPPAGEWPHDRAGPRRGECPIVNRISHRTTRWLSATTAAPVIVFFVTVSGGERENDGFREQPSCLVSRWAER